MTENNRVDALIKEVLDSAFLPIPKEERPMFAAAILAEKDNFRDPADLKYLYFLGEGQLSRLGWQTDGISGYWILEEEQKEKLLKGGRLWLLEAYIRQAIFNNEPVYGRIFEFEDFVKTMGKFTLPITELTEADDVIAGKSYVLCYLEDKEQVAALREMIESHGGTVKQRLESETDILIFGDKIRWGREVCHNLEFACKCIREHRPLKVFSPEQIEQIAAKADAARDALC